LYHFRDKAIYWLKIAMFSHPLAFDAPVMGFLSQYCAEKLERVWLPYGKKVWYV